MRCYDGLGRRLDLDTIRQDTLHTDHPAGKECGSWHSLETSLHTSPADQSAGLTLRPTPNSDHWRWGPILDAVVCLVWPGPHCLSASHLNFRFLLRSALLGEVNQAQASPFKVVMNGNYSEMIFPAYLVEILEWRLITVVWRWWGSRFMFNISCPSRSGEEKRWCEPPDWLGETPSQSPARTGLLG